MQSQACPFGLAGYKWFKHPIDLVGANPASVHPETGEPGYNLSADVLSCRKLPFDTLDEWIEKAVELDEK